jgi:hypothetical protein
MPADLAQKNNHMGSMRWVIGIGLIIVGTFLTYAIHSHDWRLAQLASITGVALLVGGVAHLATTFTKAIAQVEGDSPFATQEETEKQKEKNRSKWLTRLVVVAVVGMAVIFIYSVQFDRWASGDVASTVGVAFITAGAAWLTGALLGFLFGIPHTRAGSGAEKEKTPAFGESAPEKRSANERDDRYEPSTSLEQISDWLTKIIVGVGLTQLNAIPGKLRALSSYIAAGMGGGAADEAFAMGTTVYFSVCGFLFGFLWARLYLLEAFRAADLRRQVEKISSQMLDWRAKDLVENHLDPSKPEVPESALNDAIQKSSQKAKEEIYDRAKEAREGEDSSDATAIRAIPVFRALIGSDKAGIDHKSHAQIGYALQVRGDWKESEDALTRAIQIRDRLRRSGWKYYEFKRALARIRQDGIRDQILADLREAYSETKHQEKLERNKEIQDWLGKNGLDLSKLH